MRSYFIKRPRYEIQPEEILLDTFSKTSGTQSHKLEFPIQRKAVMLLVTLGTLFLAGSGLFALYQQTFRHAKFAAQAQENTLRNVMLQAPRGKIIDRYGTTLADNAARYSLVVISEELPRSQEERSQEAGTLAKLFNRDQNEIAHALEKGVVTNGVTIYENLSLDQALVFRAREQAFPGIRIVGTFQRTYPFGASASHTVGYTATVQSQSDQKGIAFASRTMLGKTGIEQTYNTALEGKSGFITYEVNARQDILNQQPTTHYETGNTIQVTVDAELQQYIYTALANQTRDKKGGAIGIALDPNNGDVLALVSVPGFDAQKLSSGMPTQEFQQLVNDPRKPFFNRAVQGEYSPGSTIKPFLALAALTQKIISPNKLVDDTTGQIIVQNPYDVNRPYIYHDWKVCGWVDMRAAIAQSCDVYFYTIGGGYGSIKGLGVDSMKKYLQDFLWQRKTNIDIAGEQIGFIPDPQWKEQTKRDIWRIGDTYNMSIGQGYVRTTAIQLATTYMAFVNNGIVYQPHILKRIVNPETNTTIQNAAPEILGTFPVSRDDLQIVREGMRGTVTTGSAAARLAGLPFTLAGKTGSVQTSSNLENTNALFVSFMPYENPKILLLVLVESGGEGSASAVPVSRDILEWYWYNRLNKTP